MIKKKIIQRVEEDQAPQEWDWPWRERRGRKVRMLALGVRRAPWTRLRNGPGNLPAPLLPLITSSWHPTSVFLPGKSRGQRSLTGCSPKGCKESGMTEQLTQSPFLALPTSASNSKAGSFKDFWKWTWDQTSSGEYKWLINKLCLTPQVNEGILDYKPDCGLPW